MSLPIIAAAPDAEPGSAEPNSPEPQLEPAPAPAPHPADLPALIAALPVAPAASPDSGFDRERQAAFLSALAEGGAVRGAAACARVSHQTAYRERLASPAFRRAWDAALLAARARAEEVLATRAIDGIEEQVFYHGEVVATRRRYSDRLLLAHLARLDRLTADARVEAFAQDFEGALGRFAEGSDTPETPPAPGLAGEPAENAPGQWSTRSTPEAQPRPAAGPAPDPCPDCGGRCLGPEDALNLGDCRHIENRIERMYAARPADAPLPEQQTSFDYASYEVEAIQVDAFEADLPEWWLITSEEEFEAALEAMYCSDEGEPGESAAQALAGAVHSGSNLL